MIPPGSTIGIVGGGQLGRMLAVAAARIGYHAHIFSPEADCPAAEVARSITVAAYHDETALAAFANAVNVVTFEFENIPHASLMTLEKHVPVRPGPTLLHLAQNRLREKAFLREQGIATAPFAPVTCAETLHAALREIGTPAILKTTELGYDGKGQVRIDTAEDAAQAWESLATQEAVLEGFVPFEKEISVIVARNPTGETRCYPPVENIHRDHILKETRVPAGITPAVAEQATSIARTLAEASALEGLLAVEMFVTGSEVLVNELAPRPHNSGHWSMDACVTSQFEQTIRAVCDLPLGPVDLLCPARMLNLIGEEVHDWLEYLEGDQPARLHLYGKKETRPGRKMGHVTVLFPASKT